LIKITNHEIKKKDKELNSGICKLGSYLDYWCYLDKILIFALEFLVSIIHIPIFHTYFLTNNNYIPKNLDYFTIGCLTKFYIMFEIAVNFSPGNTYTTKYLMSNITVKSKKAFFIKYLYRHSKSTFIFLTFLFIIIINSYILFLLERDFENDIKLNNFGTCIWAILITLFTVGFGDVVPYTYMGKLFCLFAGLQGLFFSSIIINAVYMALLPKPIDQRLINIIRSNALKKEFINNANKLIYRLFMLAKYRQDFKKDTNRQYCRSKLAQIHYVLAYINVIKQIKKWRDIRNKTINAISYEMMKYAQSPLGIIRETFENRIEQIHNKLIDLEKLSRLQKAKEAKNDHFMESVTFTMNQNQKQFETLLELFNKLKEEYNKSFEENDKKLKNLRNTIEDLNKPPTNVNLYNNFFT
jgi:hypothetical protein